MDQDSVDRIRSATFPFARKGYDKREVERFLNELADWLETGGGDEARADLLKRELERIGEQTSKILTGAHEAAETLRADAEREVRQQLANVNITAESLRTSADEYAEETREDADAYALKTRSDAGAYAERTRIEIDTYGEETRSEAEGYAGRLRQEAEDTAAATREAAAREADELTEGARGEAKRILADAERRRAEIEDRISELESRRDAVLGELERLASEVAGTATQHRPAPNADGAPAEDTVAETRQSASGG